MNPFFYTKESIRNKQKGLLKNISSKIEKDSCIAMNIKPLLQNSKIVMLYDPLREEPNLLNLAVTHKKITFVYPKILSKEKKQLIYVDWNSYISTEVSEIEGIPPETIDRFLLPALGYTENGSRLGRGGGYFDRSLMGIDRKKLIGVCYQEHFPLSFPEENHDLKVGIVVTDLESFFMLDDFSSPDTI